MSSLFFQVQHTTIAENNRLIDNKCVWLNDDLRYLRLVNEESHESGDEHRAGHAGLPPHLLLEEREGGGRRLLRYPHRVRLSQARHVHNKGSDPGRGSAFTKYAKNWRGIFDPLFKKKKRPRGIIFNHAMRSKSPGSSLSYRSAGIHSFI